MEISEGKGHTKVRLPAGDTTIPRHSTDLKAGTLHNILKQLGIAPEDLER
jgi:predicted RNA binding protein YcfA (HicA-like mRNA interferase family)